MEGSERTKLTSSFWNHIFHAVQHLGCGVWGERLECLRLNPGRPPTALEVPYTVCSFLGQADMLWVVDMHNYMQHLSWLPRYKKETVVLRDLLPRTA